MQPKDLNERSPVRVLEASIHGGLGRGNVGVIIARHGVGKTAFLVGVAMDGLLRGRKVLHVSMEHTSERVRGYYDDIFQDLAHEQKLEDVWKVRLEMERNRRIHSYLGGSFNMEKLIAALAFGRDHGDFRPSAIIVDGFDFEHATADDVAAFRTLAREAEAELWMSAVTHRDSKCNSRGIPQPLADLDAAVDVILQMAHDMKAVHVSLLKDHENPDVPEMRLALDPTTMLLVKES